MNDENYFKSLFDAQILMLTDIKSDIRDLKDDVSNLKTDVAVVKADVANVKNEVNDLKQTVTNHINEDIHSKNKKSFGNTPNWMLLLFIFMIGRVSVDAVRQIQSFAKAPPHSSAHEFAPPDTTYVDINDKINKKIMKKLIGD